MKQKIITTFLDLVKIPSESGNEKEVKEYIVNRLQKLPLQIVEDEASNYVDGNCGNLIVHLEGEGKPIVFDAHMDCVQPCNEIEPIIENGVIKSRGNTILGGDDKIGVANMICLLEKIVEQNIVHPPITCIFSVCEEDGLKGVKNLDFSYIPLDSYIYVLDGEGTIGSVTTKTPFGCKGILKVMGKEAHAGVCPEKGVNAFLVASHAVNQLNIGRISENLTCNIGKVYGGTARNVVMGEVTMEFEARGFSKSEVETLIDRIIKIFEDSCTKMNATFTSEISFGTPGYELYSSDKILKQLRTICKSLGYLYKEEKCGGGSNANVYINRGYTAVCLGVNMKDVHSVNESVDIQDMLKLQELLIALVKENTK